MSEDVAPYSGAIEETAKTTGKALDLVKDSARPIANIYGLVIGDAIQAARDRRLDAITRRTKKILRDRDLEDTAEVAEQIAIPLLEAAQREPREELQEIWSILLANAMDPARRDDVRQEFIETLKTFHPSDVMVLSKMSSDFPNDFIASDSLTTTGLRTTSIIVSLRNLSMQGCVQEHHGGDVYKIMPFGRELVRACTI
jgi:hypothetical protein